MSLGHRQNHRREVGTQVEVNGAHEVADILDDDEVGPVQVDGAQGALDHVALKVAQAARVNLDGRGAMLLDLEGIDVAGDVALDDGHVVAVLEGLDGDDDRGRLAGTRAGEQVDAADPVLRIDVAQLCGDAVVAVEDALGNLDGLLCHSAHLSF